MSTKAFTSYKTEHRTPNGCTVTVEHEITQDGDETGQHIILACPEAIDFGKPAFRAAKNYLGKY